MKMQACRGSECWIQCEACGSLHGDGLDGELVSDDVADTKVG